MSIVTRFAPSPTGRLHVGNVRTALINWLLARRDDGRFLLRLDDTDRERSSDAHVAAIRDDLAWLGLHPDGEVRQSARTALYDAAFERLVDAGRIYPAYETPDELGLKRKVQASRGLPPVYDRAALDLTDADRAAFEAEGRRPHWRFRLDTDAAISWHDLVRGPAHIDPAAQSDPVVRRADGSYLYMLPSTVDDIDMGITHVVRGEDHVTNSGVQLQLFAALGSAPPAFAHLPLLAGADGGKLSKRLESFDMGTLRDLDVEPQTVAALLARIGTSRPVEPVASVDALIDGFDFGNFGRAQARVDAEDFTALNAKVTHLLPYDAVAARLPSGMDAEAWTAIRPNLTRVSDAEDWWAMIAGDVESMVLPQDRDFIDEAGALLAQLDWSDDIWRRWTTQLKARTGRKGKALFMPLRGALTGRDHGPEMAVLLPLIGRERAIHRLTG